MHVKKIKVYVCGDKGGPFDSSGINDTEIETTLRN